MEKALKKERSPGSCDRRNEKDRKDHSKDRKDEKSTYPLTK